MKEEKHFQQKVLNAMERYTRLVHIFSSPDKSLGELYPFSPYTSKIPLGDCSTASDEQSLSASDDDISGSDFSVSQASSGHDPPLGRNFLLDEPPSRLHLKRRPKRKVQEESADPRQAVAGNQGKQCSDSKSAPWSSNPESQKATGHSAEGKRGLSDDAEPPRPPSRRKDGDEAGRNRSQDRTPTENRKRRRSPEIITLAAAPASRSHSSARSRRAAIADARRTTLDSSQRKASDASAHTAAVEVTTHAETERRQLSPSVPTHRPKEIPQWIPSDAPHRKPKPSQRATAEASSRTGHGSHRSPIKSSQVASERMSRSPAEDRRYIGDDALRATETAVRLSAPPRGTSDARSPRNEDSSKKTETLYRAVEMSSRTVPNVQRQFANEVTFEPCVAFSATERGDGREKRQHASRSTHHGRRVNTPSAPVPPAIAEEQRGRRLLESQPRPASPAKTLSSTSPRAPGSQCANVRTVSPGKFSIEPLFWQPLETSEESISNSLSGEVSSAVSPTVSTQKKDVTQSPRREQNSTAMPIAERHSKKKTRSHSKDRVENTALTGECFTKLTTTYMRSSRDASPKQGEEFLKRNEKFSNCSDKETKHGPMENLPKSISDNTNEAHENLIQKSSISKKQNTSSRPPHSSNESNVKQTMPTIAEDKVSNDSMELSSIFERVDYNVSNWSVKVSPSWKSSSESDITEGDSILDIEKFKQTIRSVEVPPELLEPLEESDESDNLLNILETISESPLEDCSEAQNSRRLDEVRKRIEKETRHPVSEGEVQRQVPVEHPIVERRETSGSDLSDIQLHYAYGRNKSNDQLELQWIKLEKIVDSASESSESSAIESPFSRFSMSEDLEIRSVNLPNASTAQRHGDADRGPIATYLTLPTQSPATIEDPELAIIVLREDNLSERQREVISRFRSGMKHHRKRSPCDAVVDDVYGDQFTHKCSGHPLIIPIADPHGEQGSTTAFAVIADSKPEVPLSVDVDVKSWLTKQKTEENDPLILVNRCNSRCPLEISRTSLSESRLLTCKRIESTESGSKATATYDWNKRHESDSSVSKSILEDECCQFTHNRERNCVSNSVGRHKRPASGRRPLSDVYEQLEEVLQRPKTAPPSSEGSKPRPGNSSCDKQKAASPLKRNRSRKNNDYSPGAHNTATPNDTLHAGATQKSAAQQNKKPSSRRPSEQAKTSTSNRGMLNTEDNTVRVLLEPKSKTSKHVKDEPRASRKYETDKRTNTAKEKAAEPPANAERLLKAASAPSHHPGRATSPDKRRTPDRPRTASPGASGARGADVPKAAARECAGNSPKRSQKRSLSACTSVASDVSERSGDLRRAESNASVSSQRSGRSGGRKVGGAGALSDAHAKRPQTAGAAGAAATAPRVDAVVEALPTCDSCESTASTDSQGLPRYRLKRSITYVSEYRKTIDSLRAKCVMKDHMIDALLDELRRLSPSDETYKRLLVQLSNRRMDGPPPRRDYSCVDVVDLLPSRDLGAGEVLTGQEAAAKKQQQPTTPPPPITTTTTTRFPAGGERSDCKCVCPSDFRIAGRVGCDCLLLTWKSAQQTDTVAGYQVHVDGQLSQHVRSPTRTSALLMDLDLAREMRFTLRTLRHGGVPACHAPLEILFAPSGENWALDDPAPPLQPPLPPPPASSGSPP